MSSVSDLLLDPSGFQVHEFVEEGVNKTGLFRSYLFMFREDGSVAAIGENEQISGRYLVFEDDGLTELKLMFPDVSAFSELSDDWYLISQNGGAFRFVDNRNVIEFRRSQRIDGGNGDGGSGDGGNGDGGSGGDSGNGGSGGDGGNGDGGSGGDSDNSGSVASIVEALTNSNGLKIDEFTEDGFNETSDFQSYVFLFDVDGTVVASSAGSGSGNGSGSGSGNGTTINGTYSVFVDDGQTELTMTFPASSPLYELTDDWYFLSMNGDLVRFGDSGDILQFRKN